ncbi:MAG: deaminase [bacterium]
MKKYCWDVKDLFIFGKDLINEFDHLKRKDIRALPPDGVKDIISHITECIIVRIADKSILYKINQKGDVTVIMPDEEECREVAEKYLSNCEIEFDNSIFLRWDRKKVLKKDKVTCDRIISFDGLAANVLSFAEKESKKASNWWRQVGAAIVKDGQIILSAYNQHVPHQRVQCFEGDVRGLFKRGLHIDLSTDFHAEAQLVAMAAKEGISLKRTDLYVMTFPCPPCAKIVAYSGIKRCFFNSGYAMLDGERILKDQGVEIILVK